jgi:hypothetical protein
MPLPLQISNPLQPQADALTQSQELGSTAQTTVEDSNTKAEEKPALDPKIKKLHDEFRTRIESCKQYRRKLIPNWTASIDYRRGKPFTSQTDEDQIAVNLDWSMTKMKQAMLFSQVPKIRIDHSPRTLPKQAPWAASYELRLNEILVEAGIESAMDECLPDCINAAGIGAILVSFEVITEDKQVPAFDMSSLPPDLAMQAMRTGELNGEPIPMESVPQKVDQRYLTQRISPADLLWPINFTGANFDNGPWIGRSGRITWAQAVQQFGLEETDRELVLGEDRPMMDKLTHDLERERGDADHMVNFEEVFYKDHAYDTESKSFCSIHHLVFIAGKDEPVVDEPWNGQRLGEDGVSYEGATKFPLRILTLAYITDESIPPSDSAIGRPQVNEINKTRGLIIKQKERSIPVRWFDINRIDPTIQQGLMRGTWQGMIPVQGAGDRVIGEVARANFSNDNYEADKIAKADLHEEWTLPSHQNDPNGESLLKPLPIPAQLGRERAKVASFFAGVAEVLGGLMCLYEDPQSFGEGFNPDFGKKLKYSVLADSTVLLDSGQRISRLNEFINSYAKSGWVNIEPVLQEIATLSGLDPNIVIRPPQPKPPVEPNISLRLTGVEDLLTQWP